MRFARPAPPINKQRDANRARTEANVSALMGRAFPPKVIIHDLRDVENTQPAKKPPTKGAE